MNSELGIDITVRCDNINDCFTVSISNGFDTFNGAISLKDLKRLGADINNLIQREEEKLKNAK